MEDPRDSSQSRKGAPVGSVTVLGFERRPDCMLSGTPFAGKVEMALLMAGIEYKGQIGNLLSTKHAPRGKVRHTASA